ncbi:HTH_Tnp_Tc3_2 domain-containing protein [Trichonephila clavipes]|nr:HTH_Tnp_Tc3_2 domain-containing protein [Trichonephila clavipes]
MGVTAATMAGYQDLSEFGRGVIIGAREMGHDISGSDKICIFHIRPFHKCTANIGNPIKHQICNIAAAGKNMQEQDQRRLTRIIKRDRRATLPQIAAYFNAGPSTSVTVRTTQRNIIDMGFRSQRPTSVPLLTARHKALRLTWAR